MKAIITVVGMTKLAGIVAGVATKVVAELGLNIDDISQTVLKMNSLMMAAKHRKANKISHTYVLNEALVKYERQKHPKFSLFWMRCTTCKIE